MSVRLPRGCGQEESARGHTHNNTHGREGRSRSQTDTHSSRAPRLPALLLCWPQVIEHHLRGRDYNESLLPQWINDIAESCMEELHAPKKPFKYIVSVCIMQRTGAGIHCAKACYWDTVSDGQDEHEQHNTKRRCCGTTPLTALFALCAVLALLSLRDRQLASASGEGQQSHDGMHRHSIRSVILSVGNVKERSPLNRRSHDRPHCFSSRAACIRSLSCIRSPLPWRSPLFNQPPLRTIIDTTNQKNSFQRWSQALASVRSAAWLHALQAHRKSCANRTSRLCVEAD